MAVIFFVKWHDSYGKNSLTIANNQAAQNQSEQNPVIVASVGKKHEKNSKESASIGISGLDDIKPSIPKSRKSAIEETLFNIVKTNLNSKNLDISDAFLRSGSLVTKYDKETNIQVGSFIVDIPSINESYKIDYLWSDDKNNPNLRGYTTTASCLDDGDVVYKNFRCIDDFGHSKLSKEKDPILGLLPHSEFNYEIVAQNDSGEIGLDVKIFIYSADTNEGTREDAIDKYKGQALNWIKSNNLNPGDYNINFIVE